MIKKKIILNKWLGDKFENDTKCDDCGKFSSVVEFSTGPANVIRLCPNCLNKAGKDATGAYCQKLYGDLERE